MCSALIYINQNKEDCCKGELLIMKQGGLGQISELEQS